VRIVPITLKKACAFVTELHRHNKSPRGHKFSIALEDNGQLVGVLIAGRPIARNLDDGRTIEITRTCTDGTANANSMLYGAGWRCAKAMGYRRAVTYTRADESGVSLRATGFRRVEELPARHSWAVHSVKLKHLREDRDGGVPRVRWEIP
jgi:hypothetical protein